MPSWGNEGAEEQAPETLDEATRAQLAALGYLGGSSRVRVNEDEPLADPKDKIVLYNLLKAAGTDSTEDRIEEAMAKVERVLAEDPGILEAHLILGNLFVKQEEWDGAIGAYREALSLDPEYKSAILGLADAYRLAARYDEAAAGYRRLLELDPNDNKAFYHLAEIHAAREEYEEALEVLAGLEATGEERAPARNLKGQSLLSLGRLDEAEAELRLALEMDDQLSDAWYNLALLFEERGDGSRAIEAYETRLEMAPKDFRSHFNVAKLYGAMGDRDRMEASFRAAIGHNDEFAVGYPLSVQGAAGSGRTGGSRRDRAPRSGPRARAGNGAPRAPRAGGRLQPPGPNRRGRARGSSRSVLPEIVGPAKGRSSLWQNPRGPLLPVGARPAIPSSPGGGPG